MKILNLFLFFLISTNLCIGQFEQCTNVKFDANLTDVHFVNENEGIVVGNDGFIARTEDGGESWTQIVINNSKIDFLKVDFFNDQVGIAIARSPFGPDKPLYKTMDAGKTWEPADIVNNRFIDIAILNESTCVITGTPLAIIRSVDQGETWEVIVEDEDAVYYDGGFGILGFANENVGYTIFPHHQGRPEPYLLKTINGGVTWDSVHVISEPSWTNYEALEFITEDRGFIGGWYESVFKVTDNGGLNWEDPNITPTSVFAFSIDESKYNNYYSCGHGIFKSEDKGDSWEEMTILPTTASRSCKGIFFLNDSLGWAVGNSGMILKTLGCNEDSKVREIDVRPSMSTGSLKLFNPYLVEINKIEIFSIAGEKMADVIDPSSLNLHGLGAGMYIVRVDTKEGIVTKKILKY